MKFCVTILALALFSVNMAYGQYNKFSSFELYYRIGHGQLTPSQQDKLNRYTSALTADNVVAVFIDAPASKSNALINASRIENLKVFFNGKGIPSDSLVLGSNANKYDKIIQNLSENVDAIAISISYSSATPLADIKLPKDTVSFEKVLLIESGDQSLAYASQKRCKEGIVLDLPRNHQFVLSKCDYDQHYKDFGFTRFTAEDLRLFDTVPNLGSFSSILATYHLKIGKGKSLQFPGYLKIPIEPCMDKADLNLMLCVDNACTLIPMENLYSPEDNYVMFTITQPGEYYFVHSNPSSEYTMKFKLPKGYSLSTLDIATRCHEMKYPARVDKRKTEVTIPQFYYEPLVDIVAYNSKGKKVEAYQVPISELKGEKLANKMYVHDYYDKKITDKEIIIYSEYTIEEKQFRPRL